MNDNKNESNSLLDIYGTSEKEKPQQNETQQVLNEPVVETPQPANNMVETGTVADESKALRPEGNPLENENMLTTKVEIEEKVINPEEKLLDLFTGNKLQVFEKGGFSWGTLLFPSVYLIYRKFYVQGVFFLIFNALTIFATYLNSILFIGIVGIAHFIASVIYATRFKKDYFEHCKKTVAEIMASTNDYNEQKKRCMQMGGVDPKAFVVLALIGVLSYSINGYSFEKKNDAVADKDFGLKVAIPKDFKDIERPYSEAKYQEEDYYYIEGLAKVSDDSNVCTFSIVKTTENHLDSIKTMQSVGLEYLKKSYPLLTELKSETHNDIEYQVHYDENKKIYYYIYADNESMTLIKMDIDKENDSKCTDYMKYILENTTK